MLHRIQIILIGRALQRNPQTPGADSYLYIGVYSLGRHAWGFANRGFTFPSTLNWGSLKTQRSPVIVDLSFRKTSAGKSHHYRKTLLSKSCVFKMFHVHTKTKSLRSEDWPGFRRQEQLCYRDWLVWTVGLTVEIKLRFQFSPVQCGHSLIFSWFFVLTYLSPSPFQFNYTSSTRDAIGRVTFIYPKICVIPWRYNKNVLVDSWVWGLRNRLFALQPDIRNSRRCLSMNSFTRIIFGHIATKIDGTPEDSGDFYSCEVIVACKPLCKKEGKWWL